MIFHYIIHIDATNLSLFLHKNKAFFLGKIAASHLYNMHI